VGPALVLAALLLSGCGSGPATPTPSATLPATSATPAASGPPATLVEGAGVDMCSAMPLADVQAKSPFQTPLSQFKPGTEPGTCEYRSADDAADQVAVLLTVTAFGSATDAASSLANARQANVDQGLPVYEVSGVGEQAFAAGVDEVGVHALVGSLVIDANLRGEWPDTTDDAKVAAGTELVRAILARLP
jgi:hypothetical protein